MWTRTTAEKLRAELVRLYGLIEAYQGAKNAKAWVEAGIDLRRVETALARVTIGRVR
jgi:hypothetical protein